MSKLLLLVCTLSSVWMADASFSVLMRRENRRSKIKRLQPKLGGSENLSDWASKVSPSLEEIASNNMKPTFKSMLELMETEDREQVESMLDELERKDRQAVADVFENMQGDDFKLEHLGILKNPTGKLKEVADKFKEILACKIGMMFADVVGDATTAMANMQAGFEQVVDASNAFANHAKSVDEQARKLVEKVKNKTADETEELIDKVPANVIDLFTQAATKTAATARAAQDAATAVQQAVEKASLIAQEMAENASAAVQKAADMCPKLPEPKAKSLLSDAEGHATALNLNSSENKSKSLLVNSSALLQEENPFAEKAAAAACKIAQVAANIAEKISAGLDKAAAAAKNVSAKADEKAKWAGDLAEVAMQHTEDLQAQASGDQTEAVAKLYAAAAKGVSSATSVLQGLETAAIMVQQTAEAVQIANGPIQQTLEKVMQAADVVCVK